MRVILRRFLWLFLALCSQLPAPGSAAATELTNLGQGLSYLRVQSMTESEKDLRLAVPGAGALVLDLRHVVASAESAAVLRAALAGRSTSAPLFILVSPETPAGLVDPANPAHGTVVTMGMPGSRPEPMVVVRTGAETDRRAYDALTAGTPIEVLISGKIDKDRFDEATLVQEFKNGNPDAEPPPAPDPTAAKSPAVPEKPAPLVDRVLQRAVQVDRALLVLRR